VRIGRRHRSDGSEDRFQESYEQVWRQNDELGRKVARLEQELKDYRERESLVHETLITAQRVAGELRSETEEEARQVSQKADTDAERIRDEAKADAETILEQARAKADELNRTLQAERAELRDEVARLRSTSQKTADQFRSLLLNALQLLESEFGQDAAEASSEAKPSTSGQPVGGQAALSAVRGPDSSERRAKKVDEHSSGQAHSG
jgi:cell division septum initiation protein DivIVA